MKPFNLERALAGDPVVAYGGAPVTGLHLFNTESVYKLYGECLGGIISWTIKGKYRATDGASPHDLCMAPIKRAGWINIYNDVTNPVSPIAQSCIYETKVEAQSMVNRGWSYLDTVKIEWEG